MMLSEALKKGSLLKAFTQSSLVPSAGQKYEELLESTACNQRLCYNCPLKRAELTTSV